MGNSRLPESFSTREPFTNINDAIIALNNIPSYCFVDALAIQHQLNKSLDYAVIHDSDGVINITKSYFGWARERPAGIYLSLHGITTEEYNRLSGQDLISYPSINLGTGTAYRLMAYEQIEKELTALHQRQPASRLFKPNRGYGRAAK